mgnify:FL=1
MAEITVAKVKELRDKTGAGIKKKKKALVENDGDMDNAVDWLRTKGLAKAAKKSGRTAAEGLVSVAVSDDAKEAVIVEVNAETDFVSRNETFQDAVKSITQKALESDVTTVEELGRLEVDGKPVNDLLTDLIATIGENMQLRRFERVSVDNGAIAQYVHNSVAGNLGRIGVLVALESGADKDTLLENGKKVAMHVAAAKPEALTPEGLPEDRVEREKNVLREKAKETGKPADIIEKMLEGQIRKFYSEICLLNQTFVIDPDHTVEKFVTQISDDTKIADYKLFVLGEGIEKEEENFAEEVKNAVNG